MKPSLALILLLALCSLPVARAETNEISAMTFNLRVPIDPPPYDWPSRLPRALAIIQQQAPDFIGVQEVTPTMIQDLRIALPAYAVVGRGRETGGEGEATPILFLQDRWELDKRDQGTLQLSPTPEVTGSNGWNMQWPRIFTWVHLREKKTGKSLYVFNTHFPLQAKERDLSVRLLSKTIAERKHPRDPVILTGDFNACEEEASMDYLRGMGGSPVTMKDSYRQLHPNKKVGTFHDFGRVDSCKIDYVYLLGPLKIISSQVVSENSNFSSDHYAVVAKLRF